MRGVWLSWLVRRSCRVRVLCGRLVRVLSVTLAMRRDLGKTVCVVVAAARACVCVRALVSYTGIPRHFIILHPTGAPKVHYIRGMEFATSWLVAGVLVGGEGGVCWARDGWGTQAPHAHAYMWVCLQSEGASACSCLSLCVERLCASLKSPL